MLINFMVVVLFLLECLLQGEGNDGRRNTDDNIKEENESREMCSAKYIHQQLRCVIREKEEEEEKRISEFLQL